MYNSKSKLQNKKNKNKNTMCVKQKNKNKSTMYVKQESNKILLQA
jgi:hypothetical protein